MKSLKFMLTFVVMVFLCLAFVFAHVWDTRHPAKYTWISLRSLTAGVPLEAVDGKRVLLFGSPRGFELQGKAIELTSGSNPEYDRSLRPLFIRVPAAVPIPQTDGEWEVAGTLHLTSDRGEPAYRLDVEQFGYVEPTPLTGQLAAWTCNLTFLVIAATVARFVYRAERHRWSRGGSLPGTCVDCGYDLRASKRRCPECGRGSTHRGDCREKWNRIPLTDK